MIIKAKVNTQAPFNFLLFLLGGFIKSFKLVLKSFDVHKRIMPRESYMANVSNMKFINLIYNFNSVMTDDKTSVIKELK